jgi:hypothetical protein
MATDYFGPKQTTESYYVQFDFGDDIGTGTIASATVTATDSLGADVTSTVTDATRQSITGAIVSIWVRNGADGETYLISCAVTKAVTLEVFTGDGYLPVSDQTTTPEPLPTAFQQAMQDDLTDTFCNISEFASTVVYNGVAIPAVVNYGQRKGKSDNAVSCDAWLTCVRVSDIPTPTYRDTVVIGSDSYKVFIDQTAQPEGDGLSWSIDLKRDEKAPIGVRR